MSFFLSGCKKSRHFEPISFLGTAMAISETMDLDFGYRYFATADPDVGVDLDYSSHNLTIGVRFKM